MSLCGSFFSTDSGLCIYHLFVWSNCNSLHNSLWITFSTQSYLVLYSFCVNLLHNIIIIIIIIISTNNINSNLDTFSFILLLLSPAIGLMIQVFANGPADRGSITSRVISKTQKMVLDAAVLNTQHYKVRIKNKVEQSRGKEKRPPFPTLCCSSY